MYIDNVMDIKSFLRNIAHFQQAYWMLEDSIKPMARENPVTAKEIEDVYKQMNYIAEELARFVLNRHTRVNIYNIKELPIPPEDK